jgi:hypothetical protein
MEDDLMNLASSSTIKALMPLGNIVAISWFIEADTRGSLLDGIFTFIFFFWLGWGGGGVFFGGAGVRGGQEGRFLK